jgi:uncharacterized protein involved in exopolysaccharide biosynthesis
VARTRTDIEGLEKRLAEESKGATVHRGPATVTDMVNNPSYVTLASQLTAVQTDMESVKRQITDMEKRRQEYIRRNEAAPRVEEGYKALMVERSNTQAKYDELMKRVLEARVAQGLEKEQMGERFTLIDPARLPEKPVRPNIPAILLLGIFLGIGAGFTNVSLRESADESVRTAAHLADATPYPVLGAVPAIVTEEDRRKERSRRRRILVGSITGVGATVLFFHFFIMDLDVFWARLTRGLWSL